MKASELKPGDVMDGWTVTSVAADKRNVAVLPVDGVVHDPVRIVLLELERGKGSFDQVLTSNPPQYQRKHETRRTWYRADEDVEVMR